MSAGNAPARVRGINWASPLAIGLQRAYVATESDHDLFRDVANGRDAPASTANQGTATINGIGARTLTKGAASSDGWALSGDGDVTCEGVTILWWGQVTSLDAGFRAIFHTEEATPGSKAAIRFDSDTFSAWAQSGTEVQASNPSSATAGVTYCVVTRAGNSLNTRLSIDGVQTASAAHRTQDTSFDVINIGRVGTSYQQAMSTYCVLLWNRTLSDEEIWALYKPTTRWDMFHKGVRLVTIGGGAAAEEPAASVIPQVYHNRFHNKAA